MTTTPTAWTGDELTIDKIILLLTSGIGHAATLHAASEKLGLDPANAAVALDEARRRITIAADYNRDEQLGTAILRLNDIYKRSLGVQDYKTALSVQRELSKTLGLCQPAGAITVQTELVDLAADVTAARSHFAALGFDDDSLPLYEIARRVVGLVINLQQQAVEVTVLDVPTPKLSESTGKRPRRR